MIIHHDQVVFIPGMQAFLKIHKPVNTMLTDWRIKTIWPGWGTHVNPWLFHFNVWQNPLQIKKKQNKTKPYDHLNRCRKSFWKNSTPIYSKNSLEVDIEGTYLNIIYAIYNKLTINTILSGENLKEFPLRSGIRQGCSLFLLLFIIVLDVLAMIIREEKEIKWIQIWKEEVKLSVCRCHDPILRKAYKCHQKIHRANQWI